MGIVLIGVVLGWGLASMLALALCAAAARPGDEIAPSAAGQAPRPLAARHARRESSVCRRPIGHPAGRPARGAELGVKRAAGCPARVSAASAEQLRLLRVNPQTPRRRTRGSARRSTAPRR
jgi:hypothetical protein